MEKPVLLLKGKLYKGTPESVGFDLFASEPVTLHPGQREAVPTGVITRLKPGLVGLIQDRSSIAFHHGVTVLAGVIDPDYDKEWKVVLLNTGNKTIAIPTGDRIAQVLFVETVQEIETTSESSILSGADSRTGGFGSTGT